MGESFEPGIRTALIIDELHLDRFHGGDRHDSLTDTGAQTTEQFARIAQLALRIDRFRAQVFEGAKSVRGEQLFR